MSFTSWIVEHPQTGEEVEVVPRHLLQEMADRFAGSSSSEELNEIRERAARVVERAAPDDDARTHQQEYTYMKASVLVDTDGVPVVAEVVGEIGGVEARGAVVAELDIASERSLRVAVWALQNIMSSSACHGSRRVAEQALRVVGQAGELDVAPSGLPAPLRLGRHEIEPHFPGNPWTSSTPS